MANPSKIAALILAAGASTRLGQPKQLVQLAGKTLLERACETALSIDNQAVVVVLGAHCEAIKPAIEHLPVKTHVNENWQAGMGSTIAFGMAQLPPDADAVLLLLCDQPFVTYDLLENLVGKWRENPSHVIASAYGGSFGPPAVFGKRYFAELAALNGQQGAKKLMERHREQRLLVDFPEGEMDVDTEEDLKRLGFGV
ncbi:MAG: nucleotidyltransferase family protein [Saprospiraceae bacterium]|jgi:molybdenum cofactor cytidylyltransferase|nr:nucleotidyltransferase family protein [Saprospiraceae bacterium]